VAGEAGALAGDGPDPDAGSTGATSAPASTGATAAAFSSRSSGPETGGDQSERPGAGEAGAGAEAAAATVISIPRPRGEILPQYPRSARKAGWEGVVTIGAYIDEAGKVVSAEIIASSGHESLDQAALEAVRRASFHPAQRGAKPVASRVIIPVRFRLN
jgi:protein TonB